jgi:Ca2+-binding EF-hand superfamily protein
MKRLGSLLVCLALSVAARAQTPVEALDLVLPGAEKERLRFDITSDGPPPSATWGKFLDRWFDFYDRDGDGVLNPREAARIIPIPLPGKKTAPFDFAKADADRDGKVTRTEFRAYYRAAGFTPILAIAEPATLRDLQIADAIFRHLGPDSEGILSLERFQFAPALLRKLDENEDEALTPEEVLSAGVNAALKAPNASAFRWMAPDKTLTQANVKLTLSFSEKATIPRVPTQERGNEGLVRLDLVGKSLKPIPTMRAGNAARFRHEAALFSVSVAEISPGKAVASTRQFVLAQFRSVAGSAKSIGKKQLQEDASLQLLADILPHADRDQDGSLTLAELEHFLNLIEEGVRCPLLVKLTESGRNLFLHFDANADGKLDLRELNAAARSITALGGAKGWTRTQVPDCVQIVFQRGFAASSFGPVPLANSSSTFHSPSAVRTKKGPAWFLAMDRNGDGFLSPREFLGPIEIFRRLDTNGDGLISVEEAEAATKDQE